GHVRAEIAALAQQTGDLEALRAERTELAAQPATVDAAAVNRDREELERLRQQASSLGTELQAAQAEREAATKAAAAAGATRGPIEHPPGYISVLAAQDAGAASGEALFQTFAWAMRTANTNRMLELMDFSSDGGREMMAEMLKELPKLATSESFTNDMENKGFRVVRQVPLENGDAALVMQMFDDNNSTEREAMRIRWVGNSWRIVVSKQGPEQVKLPKEQMND